MRTSTLTSALADAVHRAADGSSRRAILDRGLQELRALELREGSLETPLRTREKITLFLDHVEAAHRDLGDRILVPAFLINVVGEAMARADLIHCGVVEFLQIGLYFYGLEQVERRWPHQAAVYLSIHADHLGGYLGRKSLKEHTRAGRERLAEGRPFCITYSYLNSLRKAYWQHCRRSEDALDRALSGEALAVPEPAAAVEVSSPRRRASDRVALLLEIFRDGLSDRQRWIYLAKNRATLYREQSWGSAESALQSLLDQLAEPAPEADLGWSEIAQALGINEKTAKREYLRSLHVLLHESAAAVFGGGPIPSHYVRRVLNQIRSIVYEKELRIRDRTGRGLSTLVEKWEVALRFVLNHDVVIVR